MGECLAGFLLLLVVFLGLLFALGQVHYRFNLWLKRVAYFLNQFFPFWKLFWFLLLVLVAPQLLVVFPVNQGNNNRSHQTAAFLRLNSIVRRQRWLFRKPHCLLNIVRKSHRNRSQSHQGPVPTVVLFTLICVFSLILEELLDGNGDVPTQSDRMIPASVAQTMRPPQLEHVSYVFGVELVIFKQQTVSHGESHTCIISPDGSLCASTFKFFFLNSFMNVAESVLNVAPSIWIVLFKLSTRAESITYGHTQNWCDSSGLFCR